MQQDVLSTPLSRRALLIINPVSGKKMVLRYIPQVIRIFMDRNIGEHQSERNKACASQHCPQISRPSENAKKLPGFPA